MNVVQVSRVATLGGGCFWCTQAVFDQLRGITSTVCGYSGGDVPNPTYKDVCTGTSGHVEVVQVHYDPAEISYQDLLNVFFQTHDPTTPDRQGRDIGTQYRSIIFYHDVVQRQLAEQTIEQLNASEIYTRPVVTKVVPLDHFYPAETKHQHFYQLNPANSYCRGVVQPKVDKCHDFFSEMLK